MGLPLIVGIIPGGITVTEFAQRTEELCKVYGKELRLHSDPQAGYVVTLPGENCPCAACVSIMEQNRRDFIPNVAPNPRMILCETCGNKRCPHAAYHGNECSGSNEPGQPGSSYGPRKKD